MKTYIFYKARIGDSRKIAGIWKTSSVDWVDIFSKLVDSLLKQVQETQPELTTKSIFIENFTYLPDLTHDKEEAYEIP